MKRNDDGDVVRAFQRLASAGLFVNCAPRVKRIQSEWSSLLGAITDAQLVLSGHGLPQDKEHEPKAVTKSKSISLLEEHTGTEV